mmetsp:Transcript_14366/g.26924  ORF Transcript_14366/g.26924 Transcript_14366/m.26924 type:complete len:207 (-) Transcript_14366:93-713(-)
MDDNFGWRFVGLNDTGIKRFLQYWLSIWSCDVVLYNLSTKYCVVLDVVSDPIVDQPLIRLHPMPCPFLTGLMCPLPFVASLYKLVSPSIQLGEEGVSQVFSSLSLIRHDLNKLVVCPFFWLEHKDTSIGWLSLGGIHKIGLNQWLLALLLFLYPFTVRITQLKEVIHVIEGNHIGIQVHDSFVLCHLQDAEFLHHDIRKAGRIWLL